MAMYVPLFGAVNAQYKKADNKDHPRIIALDEAFAGVDDKNIKSMFELVHKLDFDYIMNSQALWGCFETVKGLRIAELHRPENSQVVSVIRYTWNGLPKKSGEPSVGYLERHFMKIPYVFLLRNLKRDCNTQNLLLWILNKYWKHISAEKC